MILHLWPFSPMIRPHQRSDQCTDQWGCRARERRGRCSPDPFLTWPACSHLLPTTQSCLPVKHSPLLPPTIPSTYYLHLLTSKSTYRSIPTVPHWLANFQSAFLGRLELPEPPAVCSRGAGSVARQGFRCPPCCLAAPDGESEAPTVAAPVDPTVTNGAAFVMMCLVMESSNGWNSDQQFGVVATLIYNDWL